jgi:heavy metal sensor kinase
MNFSLHHRSIRTRITLWHLVVLVITLGAYVFSTQISLWHQLNAELKADLKEEVEEIATLFLQPGQDGNLVWKENQDITENEYLISVFRLDGFPIFQNFATTDFGLPPVSAQSNDQGVEFHTLRLHDEGKLLLAQEIRKVNGVNVVIRVGRITTFMFKEMRHLLLVQALCFPLVLLLAWVGGYFVAGRVLLPLQKIIARMKTLSAERLHEQLPVENANDELGHLSITFNHLLGQLNHSFTQMRQFTGDASHELRTPLAAMHIVGEAALRSPRSVDEYKDTISSMLEEVDKMSHLVSDLLALTRADSNAVQLKFKKLELSEVVKEEMARLEVLTEEKEQKLSLTVKKTCPVCLDQNIFRQAFANILFNAIQYSPQSTSVEILVDKTEEFCYVEIIDSGPGIAPEHQSRIFDRFFRVDKVRSRDTGGSGLGLAIAQWAVEKHGGRIDLTSIPNQGSTFRISLPVQNQEHCPSAFTAMERSPLLPWPKQTGTS